MLQHADRRVFVWIALAIGVIMVAARAGGQSCGEKWLPGEANGGANGAVQAVATWDPDGAGPITPKVVVAGAFTTVGSIAANRMAAWDPVTDEWSRIGDGCDNRVLALASCPNGDLIAGGGFTTAGGLPASRVARWNSAAGAWEAMGSGVDPVAGNGVFALAAMANGDVIVGGQFGSAGGVLVNNIARWTSSTSSWSPIGGGFNGVVNALVALPNGDFIAGGAFTQAGEVPVNKIAIWSHQQERWIPLNGIGVGTVNAICVDDAGNIFAAGASANGTGPTFVERWDATAHTWAQLGAPLVLAKALAVLPNQDVVIGGQFAASIDPAFRYLLRWRAASNTCTSMGEGFSGTVFAAATLPSGQVVAGGATTSGGEVPRVNLKLWDDVAHEWRSIAPGIDGAVRAILHLSNGDRVVGGSFTHIGRTAAKHVARWNSASASWSSLGGGCDGDVHALAEMPDGAIIAGGEFLHAGGLSAAHIARWADSTGEWSALGLGTDRGVRSLLALADGRLAVGGLFEMAGGHDAGRIAIWNDLDSSWAPLGTGIGYVPTPEDASVNAIIQLPDGDLIIGGRFNWAGGVSASRIARWSLSSSVWMPAISGFSGSGQSAVHAIVVLPNGHVVFGGNFTRAGNINTNAIVKWNPVSRTWSAMSFGPDTTVYALASTPDSGVVAGGTLQTATGQPISFLARWQPSSQSWEEVSPGPSGLVYALARGPGGEMSVGGAFKRIGEASIAGFARFSLTEVPFVADHPQPATLDSGDELVLSAAPAFGYSGVNAQWFRDGVALADGDAGCPGGSVITGSSFVFPSPTDGTPATLRIRHAQPSDSGAYSVAFSNSCGNATSDAAAVVVNERCPACPADFDSDGGVTCTDMSAFIHEYEAGQTCADVNLDGGVDASDLATFIGAYQSGGC